MNKLRIKIMSYLMMPPILLSYSIGVIMHVIDILKRKIKMRKLIVVLLLVLVLSLPVVVRKATALETTKSELLEYLIKNKHYSTTSKLMSQEIIRQLKEKEGMTIREYLIKLYFKELMDE